MKTSSRLIDTPRSSIRYFYQPSSQGYEASVAERLDRWREAQCKALGITTAQTIPDLPQATIDDIKHRHKPDKRIES